MSMMRAALLFGLAAAQDHDHHHAHGHGAASCGCEKDEEDHPFTMSCSDLDTIRQAGKDLAENCGEASEANCKGALAAGNPLCQTAFFILQAHHDYCDHDTLTKDEEKVIHDWEAYCIQCAVYRGHGEDLATCPMIDCENPQPAIDAHDTLVADCVVDGECCTTDATTQAFRTVIAYHDLCAHDDIPEGVEKAVHDYEHACEDYMCNVVKSGYDGTVCEEDYADQYLLGIGWMPEELESPGALDSGASVFGLVSAALLLRA